MPSIAIVPAAGKAERFGGAKLTTPIGGEPLLNHTLRSLLDGGIDAIVVVTGPDSDLRGVTLIDEPRVIRAVNGAPQRGMLSSIQEGLKAAAGDPMLILPGDMPFVRASTVALVLQKARETLNVVSPVYQGKRGHPVAMPGSMRNDILKAGMDATLATWLEGAERTEIEVTDPGVLRDVDVREDLPPSEV